MVKTTIHFDIAPSYFNSHILIPKNKIKILKIHENTDQCKMSYQWM